MSKNCKQYARKCIKLYIKPTVDTALVYIYIDILDIYDNLDIYIVIWTYIFQFASLFDINMETRHIFITFRHEYGNSTYIYYFSTF